MPLNLDSLDDAEKFQKHFVTPIVDAVKTEVKTLVDDTRKEMEALKKRDADQQADIDSLKLNQKKALAGYGFLSLSVSTAVGLLYGATRNWVKKHFGV